MAQDDQLLVKPSQTNTSINDQRFGFFQTFWINVLRLIMWLLGWPKAFVIWYITDMAWNIYMLDYNNPGLIFSQMQCQELPHNSQLQSCADFYKAIAVPFAPLFSSTSPIWIRTISYGLLALIPCFYIWAKVKLKHTRVVREPIEVVDLLSEGKNSVPSSKMYTPPFEIDLLAVPMKQPGEFIGHKEDVREIVKCLSSKTKSVIALYGMAGIGKTSLAAKALLNFNSKRRFPDGIVVISCLGINDPLAIINFVLDHFKQEKLSSEKHTFDEFQHIVGRFFAGKKVLIMLDNIEPNLTFDDVIKILCASQGVKVLLTTQQRPTIFNFHPIEVKELSEDDAIKLFISCLRPREIFATNIAINDNIVNFLISLLYRSRNMALAPEEMEAIKHIVRKFRYHTLAIKLIAMYAAETKSNLKMLANDLDKDPNLALEISYGNVERAMEGIFNKSVEDLEEVYQLFFTALALFPSTRFSRYAARDLALAFVNVKNLRSNEKPEYKAREIVNKLITRGLLEVPTKYGLQNVEEYESVSLHPLLRLVAERNAVLTKQETDTAKYAIAKHYAEYVTRENISEEILNYDLDNISGALKWAFDNNQNDLVVTMSTGMQSFWRNHGLTKNIDYLERCIQTANYDAIDIELTYGKMLRQVGKLDVACTKLEETLGRVSDDQRKVEVLVSLGQVEQQRGSFEKAKGYFNEGMRILQPLRRNRLLEAKMQKRNRLLEAKIQRLRGEIAHQDGALEDARSYYLQSFMRLGNSEEPDQLKEKVRNLVHLGEIALLRGKYQEAEQYYDDALSISRNIGSGQLESWVSGHKGYLAYKRGQPKVAKEQCEYALLSLSTINHPYTECWLLGNVGHVTHMIGASQIDDLNSAKEYLSIALQKAKDGSVQREKGRIEGYLAMVAETQADIEKVRRDSDEEQYYLEEAEQYYKDATENAVKFDKTYYADISLAYAIFLEKQGRYNEAYKWIGEVAALYIKMMSSEASRVRQLQKQYGSRRTN